MMLRQPFSFAAEYFLSELLLYHPHHFQLEAIPEELVAVLEVYSLSSLEPPQIACRVVGDIELVRLISEVYELTIHRKHDAYRCWSNCQFPVMSD